MTPEYLESLADDADPDELWKLPSWEQHELPIAQRRQLDAGVALRRHASHVRSLRDLLGHEKSLLITPLSSNGTATAIVRPPQRHLKLLRKM